jgi:23S rRNA pseudouridine2605 synthase
VAKKTGSERSDSETGTASAPAGDKLQKILADAGLGSRREMERWIGDGRVTVDDEPAHLGQRVGPDARITVDGKPLKTRKRKGANQSADVRVLLYNKPVGEVCTRKDPEGRKTIFDNLPELGTGRWISIGRLDIATGGLLLLTTDGTLANRMMHPSTGLDREYAVRVNGTLSDEQREALLTGIEDDGEILAFSDIQYFDGRGTNHWYHVVLLEGKNREIRRLFESCGLMVSRLKRVRFGPVVLPSRLARGRYETLSEYDMRELYRLLKLPEPARRTDRRKRTSADRQAEKKATVLIPYPELEG